MAAVDKPFLLVLSGLPGVGKTTLSRAMSRRTGAVFLRIDAIESAIVSSALDVYNAEDAGYLAANNLARENLELGHSVIADAVNPVQIARDAWSAIASQTGARLVNVEIVCSDRSIHRQRIEERSADLPGHRLPDWQAVEGRDYTVWQPAPLVIDTANRTVEECVEVLLTAVGQTGRTGTPRSAM